MEASTAVSSRLIGAFFVEKGLVTQEQLELALRKQEQSGERLGEIIVAEFGVSRLELASVLAEQWAEFERDSKARDQQAAAASPAPAERGVPGPDAEPVEPQLRRPIGEIFLERGFVTPDDLDRALDVQRETGTRLGEVLVEQGSLSRLDLASALAEQWSSLQKLRPPEPVEPTPWQNGAPEVQPAQGEVPSELRRSLEELADRVRAVELASAATPWNEDLRLLGDNVRAAIATVEERVTKTAMRVDPAQLEALGTALDELRERVQEPATRLDAVERRLGELPSVEALEERLEARLAELRSALEGSVVDTSSDEDLASLREQLAELNARVSVVPDEVTELRSQVAALAAGSSSADEVAVLRGALEELSARAASADDLAALQARLDETALRVVVPEALAEVRAEVAALARQVPAEDELAGLRATVEELSARVVSADDVAALRERLEEMASRIVTPEALQALRVELAGLTARPAIGREEIDELRSTVTALGERVAAAPAVDPELEQKLAAVGGEAAAARSDIASLASRLDELGALRPRVDEIAGLLPGVDAVEELRRAVDELAARVATDVPREEHDAQVRDVLARVEELASRVERVDTRNIEPSGPRLREILDGMRAEIGSLAARPVVDADTLEHRLAALEQRGPDPAVESLAASVADEKARVESRLGELAAGLEARLVELERRLADGTPFDELRAELGRLADSVAGDHASLQQVLHARVEELAASTPSPDDVSELRARLAELAAQPATDDELRTRVDELSSRLEQALAAIESLGELRRAVDRLDSSYADGLGSTAERLAGLETAVAALDGVEWRLQTHLEESVAVRAADLEHRVEDTMRRLDALDALEERIEALKADLDAHPGPAAVAEATEGLRAELAALADRLGSQERALAELPSPVDLTPRLDDLGLRLDDQARAGAERLGQLGEDLRSRIAEATDAARREASEAIGGVAGRVEEIDRRLESLAPRDEVHGSIAEHAAAVAAELETIRRASEERERALAERLAGLADREELASLDRVLRQELESRTAEVHERLGSQDAVLADLRLRLDELQAASAGQEEWRTSVESMLHDRIAELEQRVGSETAETRARVERAEQALQSEVGSLGARVDELLGLRHQDLKAARAANDALAASVDELRALHAQDTDAAQAAAGELASRMEELAASLRSESAAASSAAQQLVARVGELESRRAEDLEAARAASAELVSRLDDLAIRTAAAAAEADRALRSDLYTLAATVEQKEAAGIESHDELRLELERASSSLGWRLERIEEALAADDRERLREAVAELERRLEQQVAQQDEQVRVTERALRKGLAALGERLADTQTAYLDAGNALRRSIERLGAAVVEADARMADQIPVADVEGYVAFAPTSEGYRLVQVPGAPPELGATLELEGIDGPLVVTRFGRSPLPLDSRPCAYLDRP